MSASLSLPYLHALPNALTLHLAQTFLSDHEAVFLARTSPHLCTQLNGSIVGGRSSAGGRYLIKNESTYYFVFTSPNAQSNVKGRVRYVTNRDPRMAGFRLESSIVAELVDQKEGGVSGGEADKKEEKEEPGLRWIVRTSKWCIGTPSKLRLHLPMNEPPIRVEFAASDYHIPNSLRPVGVDPSALIADEELKTTENRSAEIWSQWEARIFYDCAFIPSSLESLGVFSRLCHDPFVPRLTHCRRLHTLWFAETLRQHLTVDPAEVFPPSLRFLTYGGPPTDKLFDLEPAEVRFPQTITEIELKELGDYQNTYFDNLNLIPFPDSVEIFRAESLISQDLSKWTKYPLQLRELYLGDRFQGNIDGWIVPTTLKTLQFGWEFNQSFDRVKLPEGLTQIHFGPYFTHSLANARFPRSLKKFTIGSEYTESWQAFDQELPDLSHTQIESFAVPPQWDRSLDGLRLPQATLRKLIFGHYNQPIVDSFLKWIEGAHQLTHLAFGRSFNQPVDGLMKAISGSTSLTHLSFKDQFNHPLDPKVPLPRNLEHLSFGFAFTQSLREFVFPASLTELTLGAYNAVGVAVADGAVFLTEVYPDLSQTQVREFKFNLNLHVDGLKFPPTLKKLQFGDGYNRSIKQLELPAGLTLLEFGREFNAWSEKVRMPDSLEELGLNNTKVITPIGDLSHTKLKSLMLPPKWNASLAQLKLPPTLHTLAFGRDFCKTMSDFTFPQALTSLTFNLKFNDASFSTVILPSSLRQLRFSQEQRAAYNHPLPSLVHLKQLHTLILSAKWNRPAEELKFYLGPFDDQLYAGEYQESNQSQGLRHLEFGDEWNQPVDGLILPSTLLNLQFGSHFVHPLDHLVLPLQLTKLECGAKWNHSLEDVRLPSSIRFLRFGPEFNQSLSHLRLPRLESFQLLTSASGSIRFDRIESIMQMSFPKAFRHITLPSSKNPRLLEALAGELSIEARDNLISLYANFLKQLSMDGTYVQEIRK